MALFNKKTAPLTAAATPGKVNIFLPVFREGGTRHIFVQPGGKHPEVAEWVEQVVLPGHAGRSEMVPRNLQVKFMDGKAEVDEKLVRYLINENLASATPGRAWVPGEETA